MLKRHLLTATSLLLPLAMIALVLWWSVDRAKLIVIVHGDGRVVFADHHGATIDLQLPVVIVVDYPRVRIPRGSANRLVYVGRTDEETLDLLLDFRLVQTPPSHLASVTLNRPSPMDDWGSLDEHTDWLELGVDRRAGFPISRTVRQEEWYLQAPRVHVKIEPDLSHKLVDVRQSRR